MTNHIPALLQSLKATPTYRYPVNRFVLFLCGLSQQRNTSF